MPMYNIFVIGEDKTEFNVNRAFWAQISPVFEAMLYGKMKEGRPDSDVFINDTTPGAFQSVLNFAYCNDPEITAGNVLSVRHLCDKYQITLLADLCDKYVSSCLNSKSLCSLLNEAVQLHLDEIIVTCLQYLETHFQETHMPELLNQMDFLK